MLLVVVFTFFYRDSEIVALEIHLADCQRALGSRWGMQDMSYRQNLLDFRKESRRPEWKNNKKSCSQEPCISQDKNSGLLIVFKGENWAIYLLFAQRLNEFINK